CPCWLPLPRPPTSPLFPYPTLFRSRHRAAIIATVIHYRPRSAIRDVGKALGLTEDVTAVLADTVWGSWGDGLSDMQVRQAGLDPDRKSTRLNSSHVSISYAVFCLKK